MFGFGQLIDILKKNPKKILFTEGSDPRILEAASRLLAGTFLHPILVGNEDWTRNIIHGVFYSIIDPEVKEATFFTTNTAEDGKMTLTANLGYTITVDGSSNPLEIPKNQAARVVVTKTEGNVVVYDQVIKDY